MPIIRTQKHMTIIEAHPFHHYISDDRDRGGNALVDKGYDPSCPLCRAEKQDTHLNDVTDQNSKQCCFE